MIDDTEVARTHILIWTRSDGKEERWGPMPKRLAELTKEALDDNGKPPWYRSPRIVEAP